MEMIGNPDMFDEEGFSDRLWTEAMLLPRDTEQSTEAMVLPRDTEESTEAMVLPRDIEEQVEPRGSGSGFRGMLLAAVCGKKNDMLRKVSNILLNNFSGFFSRPCRKYFAKLKMK